MSKRSEYANRTHPSSRERLSSHETREQQAQSGCLICTNCGAGYHDKHWYSVDQSLKHDMIDAEETLCPGCYRVENQICNGRVLIEGPELHLIHDELLHVIDRVVHECWLDNPTSRMFDLIDHKESIELKTTTEWLAKRIGKSLKKTYDGMLEVKRSPEKNSVFVRWFAIR